MAIVFLSAERSKDPNRQGLGILLTLLVVDVFFMAFCYEQDHVEGYLELSAKTRYMFMTEEDITSLPCFQNKTLLAVKSPTASCIEVPDPDEVMSFPHRQYQMVIRSRMGPIDVYLLSKYKGDSMETDEPSVDTSSLKIVTSDTDLKTDYWFESGEEVTLTDLWNNFC